MNLRNNGNDIGEWDSKQPEDDFFQHECDDVIIYDTYDINNDKIKGDDNDTTYTKLQGMINLFGTVDFKLIRDARKALYNNHDYVYRVLRCDEDVVSGIYAKGGINCTRSISQHVASGSKHPSWWISSTLFQHVALRYALFEDELSEKKKFIPREKPRRIARIDLKQIIAEYGINSMYDTRIINLNDSKVRERLIPGAIHKNYARKSGEVLFHKEIPIAFFKMIKTIPSAHGITQSDIKDAYKQQKNKSTEYDNIKFKNIMIVTDVMDDLTENVEQLKLLENKQNTLIEEQRKDIKMTVTQKEKVKLLFLDVDGVLNFRDFDDNGVNGALSMEHLSRLKQIMDKTQCKIILSTSWRRIPAAKTALFVQLSSVFGIDLNKINEYIFGDTPVLGSEMKKSVEICEYLQNIKNDENYDLVSWAAIDDMPLDKIGTTQTKETLENHFVKTDVQIGLSHINVLEAIEILNVTNVW